MGAQGAVICRAVSHDLVRWDKDPGNPILRPDTRWYSDGDRTWRDPCVVWNGDAGCYWMVLCARTQPHPADPFTGCLGLATSTDLEQWEVRPPIWAPGHSTVVECPDLFRMGERWVLMYYWHDTRLRLASSASGPWTRPPTESTDSFGFVTGKTMWDGGRRLVIGWVPRHVCDCAPLTWGGTMLLPRELWILDDGAPATSLPREVLDWLLHGMQRKDKERKSSSESPGN